METSIIAAAEAAIDYALLAKENFTRFMICMVGEQLSR